MAIENRILEAGTVLVAHYRGERYTAEVVAKEDGDGVGYRLDATGVVYNSPSSAGMAVMNGTACNGWRFWSIEGTEKAPRQKADPKVKEPKAPKAAKVKTFANLKKTRKQPEQPDGTTCWYCSTCQSGFYLPTGETPETCPEGHPARMEDTLAPEGIAVPAE